MQKTSINGTPILSEEPVQHSLNPATTLRESELPIVAETRNLIREAIERTRKNFIREIWDWMRCKRLILPSVKDVRESFAGFESSAQNYEDEKVEAGPPIFLLATSWRSGSTLLQRILVTDPRVMLWGEPLAEMTLVSELVEMLIRLSSFPHLKQRLAPDDSAFISLATSWIATLSPPGCDFRAGLRSLMTRWLGEPARQRGFSRWGFKEVRLGAPEATLLHWLYPNAKFVLLSRNPYDCYRSLADSRWRDVYHRFPDLTVDSAAMMARHWNRIALSWSELGPEFPAFQVKYEDIITGNLEFRKLESWLGIEIRENVALSKFVGKTARRTELGWWEHFIISREAKAGMRFLGYS